jgi:putative membrane protein
MFLLTPLVLFLTGCIVLHKPVLERNWRVLIWLAFCFMTGFTVEAIGVSTGKIFGLYSYGEVLGPGFFGVPLVIGFNWMIVLFCSVNAARFITDNRVLSTFIASLFPVILDFIMEPVAVAFKYWQWHSETVPLRNYLAWWIISLFLSAIYHAADMDTDRKLPAFYLAVLGCYFLILNGVILLLP